MKLNIRKEGDTGPELVILHGMMGSARNWQSLTRELSEEFRLIVPDLRNHGESPHGPHSISLLSEDVIELIEENCDEPPHIIGHSMGGQAAMAVATSGAVKISSLIVADAAPMRKRGNLQAILEALMRLDLGEIKSRPEADEVLSGDIPEQRIRLFLLQNLKRKDTGELYWRINLPELYRYVVEEEFEIAHGSKYEGPTLVLAGGRSEYRVWEQEDVYRAHFPNMTLEVFNDAGHWLHSDAFEKFVERVRRFINSAS